MTVRDLIEMLKKYKKYYKIIDASPEGGVIEIRDENGKYIDSINFDELTEEPEAN